MMHDRKSSGAIRSVVLAGVAAVSIVAFGYWFLACPCDRVPGGYLVGAQAAERVTDWSFANEVTLCQIQIDAGILPHSINLNCMSTPDGDLYLSCSGCATKPMVQRRPRERRGPSAPGRYRLPGDADPDHRPGRDGPLVGRARGQAQRSRLPRQPPPPTDTPRPDGWWTFRVEWRS